ncbi:Quinone oxidoreductase 2 [Fusarium oxysporum f. sp. conglutinans]|nr:Quinone oxidoreductase 2 [Fusarium oxysporum f. sp. conglutinans]
MSHSHSIGIFPASGGIGGGTVKHMLTRLPPTDLILISRHPENLASVKAQGAEIRQADYDDDSALHHAFHGIDTLFLISFTVPYANPKNEKRHKAAIDAAIRSGVKYIFYGSLGFAGTPDSKESVAHVMQAHLDTEKYLETCRQNNAGFAGTPDSKESVAHVMQAHLDTEKYLETCRQNNAGFAYTIVREGLYSESYPLYTAFFDPARPRREVKIPHDGSGPGISWVKREELGEGTAELISRHVNEKEKFQWQNKTILLSGEKTLTLAETVAILGEVAEVPLQIKQVSVDEFATQPNVSLNFTYHGADLSKPWATAFEAFRQGEASWVSPILKELLGREPEDFKTTICQSM